MVVSFPFITSSLLAIAHLRFVSSQSVVTTIVVTAAPTIPSDAPSFVDHDTFTSAILNSTNYYRESYNASSVRWNATLESFASSYLNKSTSRKRDGDDKDDKGKTCNMAHSNGPYGENLALGCSTAGSCVDMWAGEASEYDYNSPGFGEDTGHFTQLVWRDTTDVGCGAVLCPGNGGWYLACEYWPRGNVIGAFADEVDRPKNSGSAAGAAAVMAARAAAALTVGVGVGFVICGL
ncbi:PR-1-like protein [Hypoxylon sp. NC1633]|nr:PR-1-like protein [Hypoxylon sp. NC1633]